MDRQHTSQIRYIHSQLARDVPIGAFVELMEPESIGLTDKNQFYAPVRFSVQVCGGINAPAGAIRVDVPVHANSDWLSDMKERFAGMMGIDSSASSVEFKTVDGKSLDDFPVDFLDMAGKLHVYVDGKEMRLPKLPEIPMEYRVDKESKVDAWYQKVAQELPELLAGALVGKNIDQVNAAIRGEGPVQEIIAAEMRKAASPLEWAEFARTHNINSPAILEAEEGSQVLNAAAKEALLHVRKFIEVSAKQINHYITHEQNLKTKPHPDDIDAPVLGKNTASLSLQTGINGFEMYQKLMTDAFTTPVVQQAVVERVYNMPIGDAECKYRGEARPREERGGGKKKATTKKSKKPALQQTEALNTLLNKYMEDSEKVDGVVKYIPRGDEKLRKIEDELETIIKNLTANNLETSKNRFDGLLKEFEKTSMRFHMNGAALDLIQEKLEVVSNTVEDLKNFITANLENFRRDAAQTTEEKRQVFRDNFDKKMATVSPGFFKRFVNRTTGLFSSPKGKEEKTSEASGEEEFVSVDEGDGSTSEEEKDIPAAPKGKKQNSPGFFKQFEDKYSETVDGKQKPAGYRKDDELDTSVRTFLEKGLAEMPSKEDAREKLNGLLENLKKARKFYEQNLHAIEFIRQKSKEKTQFSETEFSKLIEQEKSNFDAQANAAVKHMVDTYTTYFETRYESESSDEEPAGPPPPKSQSKKQSAPLEEQSDGGSGSEEEEEQTQPAPSPPVPKEKQAKKPDNNAFRREKIQMWLLNNDSSLGNLDAYINFIETILNNKTEATDAIEVHFQKIFNVRDDKLPNSWDRFKNLFFDNKLKDDARKIPFPPGVLATKQFKDLIRPFLNENAIRLQQNIRKKLQVAGINSRIGSAVLIGNAASTIRNAQNKRNLQKLFAKSPGTGEPETYPKREDLTEFLLDYLENSGNREAKARLIENAFSGTDDRRTAFGGTFTYTQYVKGQRPSFVSSGLSRWRDFKSIFKVSQEMFLDDDLSNDANVWARRKEYLLNNLDELLTNAKLPNDAKLRLAPISAHHPWNALIHHTLQPEAGGAYPAYYNLLHTKQDMSSDASFGGDVETTYAAHHLFSGAAPLPPAMKIGGTLKQKQNVLPKLIPLESNASIPPRPPLKKISSSVPVQDDTLSLLQEKMRARLVPIKSGLPKLIPIETSNYGLPSVYDDDF